ncbi:MAG: hypothetical protein A3B68_09275 [Candidatus Melainabacteria bacterium RIFCSPHIGHO2_02_FULL_34_12]|nr:MAG: hypothetical protein A3B68_09275 [Candidatus Melainabacteria bacterium RIFCSPHIGHO2_02_FULL_34_12]
MKLSFLKSLLLFLILNYILLNSIPSICQTEMPETVPDPTKKYDELFNKPPETQESTPEPVQEDELVSFLPKLDNELYKNWSVVESPRIITTTDDDVLKEAGFEKVLKQSYKKENHIVDIYIYKFKDFAGAYSAFTVLHRGAATKLEVGRNASENDSLVDFWKGNYFVNIQTLAENDKDAKEFIVLSSQDISKNITDDKMPPVIVIQMPSLNRVQGTEKYCLGIVCCQKYLASNLTEIDFNSLHLNESGGIITAQYQFPENKDERITLLLLRYIEKQTAAQTFNYFKESFEKKKADNYDTEEGILKIKNEKSDYTYIKQRGNLLGIAFAITNKKSGEQLLNFIPWPIEITKPKD